MFMPFPLIYLAFLPAIHSSSMRILAVVFIILATLAFCGVFYLLSRLEFAFFDILANKGEFVAPAWRKYGPQAFRWSVFKALIGIPMALVIGLPFYRMFKPLMQLQADPKTPPNFPFADTGQFFLTFFAIFFGFMLLLLVGTMLSDFIVPSLALENTSIGEAFRRFALLVRTEPGPFLFFICLKAVLGFIGYYVVIFVAEIAVLLVALVLGLIAFLLGSLLHAVGVPWYVLHGIAIALAIPGYFGLLYVVSMAIGAYVTFLQAWGLYFLGGRYPLLGDVLTRSTPNAPWPFPYPPPENWVEPPPTQG